MKSEWKIYVFGSRVGTSEFQLEMGKLKKAMVKRIPFEPCLGTWSLKCEATPINLPSKFSGLNPE